MRKNKNVLVAMAVFFLIVIIVAIFFLRDSGQGDAVIPAEQEIDVLESDDEAIKKEIEELERRLEEAIRMIDPELIEGRSY